MSQPAPGRPAGRRVEVVAFDGDDTLWHSENLYACVQEAYRELLAGHAAAADLERLLDEAERRNLPLFGYGVKGFTFSLIETAIEVTEGRITAAEIQRILDWGRWMLSHPVELLAGVAETIPELAAGYRLALITKGDLLHQESKIAGSGLAGYFTVIEIVTEKDVRAYRRIMHRLEVVPPDFVMVGNSPRSDVLPVLEAGGRAVHIPYRITWTRELALLEGAGCWTLASIRELPGLLGRLSAGPDHRPA